ncbi:hypothetical protein MNBD_GAMMA12-432 [hydrothermal vent metagenome]|uniref:Rhodanese domain-containing protein n=1 Tax=hydrothermal vent metagenome TaxID=652676 RepID=A0A3B0YIJ4_9ZZZZ
MDKSFSAFLSLNTTNTILFGIFLALITLLVVTEFQRRGKKYNDVRPVEAIGLINHQNAVVIDVRPKEVFKKGHLTNAINIPLEELKSNPKKADKYKNKAVIIYCNSGNTSIAACKLLEEQGFELVHNMRGGILAWERDSYPVITR